MLKSGILRDFIDAYGHYYGKLKNYAKKMNGVKMI